MKLWWSECAEDAAKERRAAEQSGGRISGCEDWVEDCSEIEAVERRG
jgi:hypothetical protein